MAEVLGRIQLYTGEGKGKTTAGLGLAIRSLGAGKRTAIIYFDKGGNHYGERKILDQLKSDIFNYYVCGALRFDPIANTFRFGVEEIDKAEARRGLKLVAELFIKDELDLLVLDEINSTIALGMLELAEVLKVLEQKPADLELVLTGRNAPQELLDISDLVTEMKLVKHYYYAGQEAREGIEY